MPEQGGDTFEGLIGSAGGVVLGRRTGAARTQRTTGQRADGV